jgi:hypothetical protein
MKFNLKEVILLQNGCGWYGEEMIMFSCLEYNSYTLGLKIYGLVTILTELFQRNATVCIILLFQIRP